MSVKAGRATVAVIARSLLASILPELLMPVVLTRLGARLPDRLDLRLRHLATARPQAGAGAGARRPAARLPPGAARGDDRPLPLVSWRSRCARSGWGSGRPRIAARAREKRTRSPFA